MKVKKRRAHQMNNLTRFMKERKNCKYYYERIGEDNFLIAPRGELVTIFDKFGRRLKPSTFINYIAQVPEHTLNANIRALKKKVEKQMTVEEV